MKVFVLEGTERKDVMEPLVNQYSTLINLCEVLVQRVASSVSDRQPSNSLLMALEARRVRNPSSHAIVGQFRGLGGMVAKDGNPRFVSQCLPVSAIKLLLTMLLDTLGGSRRRFPRGRWIWKD